MKISSAVIFNLQCSIFNQKGFIEALPDVAWATAMDGSLAVAPNIYINKVALTDFEGLLFDGEVRDKVRAEGRTGFL